VDEQQWLLVRQLSVTAPQAELRLRTAQALDSKIHRAVDGRTAAARHADAVYFHSLPQLLAFLLRDLAWRDLASKWYWQRWAYLLRETQDQAVTRLLWENSEYLPAIIEELMVIDSLSVVWRQLSADGALQILQKLPGTAAVKDSFSDTNQAARQSRSSSCLHLARQTFLDRHTDLSPWREVLAALPESDPRCQLAAVIAGLQNCPLPTLQDRQAVIQAFNTLLEILDGDAAAPVPDEKVPDDTGHGWLSGSDLAAAAYADASGDRVASAAQGSRAAVDRPARLFDNPDADMSQREEAAGKESTSEDRPVFGGEDALPQISEERLAKDGSSESSERHDDAAPSPSERELSEIGEKTASGLAFTTRCAGLFYLINALNDKDCLELLWQPQEMACSSGWLWLFALARHLDAELDLPILQFLAEQYGCQDVETLLALPGIANMDEVEALLDKRYRDQDFWNASLILVPARVVATASHIDIYFPLAAVRLSVRLAALDVNPGWVPWLGRVVTLYYRDAGAEGLRQ